MRNFYKLILLYFVFNRVHGDWGKTINNIIGSVFLAQTQLLDLFSFFVRYCRTCKYCHQLSLLGADACSTPSPTHKCAHTCSLMLVDDWGSHSQFSLCRPRSQFAPSHLRPCLNCLAPPPGLLHISIQVPAGWSYGPPVPAGCVDEENSRNPQEA